MSYREELMAFFFVKENFNFFQETTTESTSAQVTRAVSEALVESITEAVVSGFEGAALESTATRSGRAFSENDNPAIQPTLIFFVVLFGVVILVVICFCCVAIRVPG